MGSKNATHCLNHYADGRQTERKQHLDLFCEWLWESDNVTHHNHTSVQLTSETYNLYVFCPIVYIPFQLNILMTAFHSLTVLPLYLQLYSNFRVLWRAWWKHCSLVQFANPRCCSPVIFCFNFPPPSKHYFKTHTMTYSLKLKLKVICFSFHARVSSILRLHYKHRIDFFKFTKLQLLGYAYFS